MPSRAIVLGVRDWKRSAAHAAHSRLMAWEFDVTFFCFLDSDHLSMAHIEPLDADTFEDARHQASHLLKHHRSARAARIYLDTQEVAILRAEGDRA